MPSTERVLRANGVDLCTQTFGDPGDPAVLLIGNSMLTWEDDLCGRLAAGRRFVVRYDLRDTGRSTTVDPDAPNYNLRDLVADAVGVLDALELQRAHVVGFGVGGWIAQLVGLDHRDRVSSLTLVATRPTAPGPNDPDLPEHSHELMSHLMGAPEPDWSERAAVVDSMVESARHLAGSGAFDEAEVREHVGRIFDRTIDATPTMGDPRKAHGANQMATAFAALDSGGRWRERLGAITAPTLVIHGAEDPFFPLGNAEALAREIPGSELLVLHQTGQELPRRVWDELVAAVIRHTSDPLNDRRPAMPRITPNLWFDTEGKDAAEFYVSVFPNSEITNVSYYGEAGPGPAGTVLTVDFVLDGQEYTAINGGPQFSFDEAISLLINCADQDEVDYYWAKLTEGGEEVQCGWLKDRYGLSWQVCPVGMGELLGDPDPGRSQRAMQAMLGMKKIDLAALRAAADQPEPSP